MDKEHVEMLKKLFESEDFHDEDEMRDNDETDIIIIKNMTRGRNNPCSHEGQHNCEMRCKHDNCSGNSFQHCHVNNCNGDARCNVVYGGCINRH
jgi:hypothetical protein